MLMSSSPVSEEKAGISLSNKPYLFSLGFLFLIAMHYYQLNGGGEGLTVAVNNSVWIAASLIITVGMWRVASSRRFIYSALDVVVFFVVVLLFVPLLWSESPWRETVYDRYLALVAFWLLVVCHRQFQLSEKEQQLFWGLVGAAVFIQSIFGVLQFFYADELPGIKNQRPIGIFQQVNVFASFLATGLALSFYQLLREHQGLELHKYLKLLHVLNIPLIGCLQILIMSRVGLLASALVLFLLIALYWDKKKTLAKLCLLFCVGMVAALSLQQLTDSKGRDLERMATPGFRAIQYSLTWEMIQERPLLGYGLGTFQRCFQEKLAQEYHSNPRSFDINDKASSHPHNELLFWWFQAGVLPILLFLFLGCFLFYKVFKRPNREKLTVFLLLLPIVLHTQTELPLYHSAFHLVLLSLLLASVPLGGVKVVKHNKTFLPRMIAVCLFPICSFFMVTNLQAIHYLGRYIETDDFQYMTKVINPFGSYRIYNLLYVSALMDYRSPSMLQAARDIQQTEVKLAPSVGVYHAVIDLEINAGDFEAAKMWLDEGAFLFPKSSVLKNKKNENWYLSISNGVEGH